MGASPHCPADVPRPARPASVWVAGLSILIMVATRGLLAAWDVFTGMFPLNSAVIQLLPAVAIGLLVVVGVFRGDRLAWQWGRVAAILGALILTMLVVPTLAGQSHSPLSPTEIAVLASESVPLYVAFFALGSTSAKEFFRLRCPQCGKFSARGGDFLYNTARCGSCDHVW